MKQLLLTLTLLAAGLAGFSQNMDLTGNENQQPYSLEVASNQSSDCAVVKLSHEGIEKEFYQLIVFNLDGEIVRSSRERANREIKIGKKFRSNIYRIAAVTQDGIISKSFIKQ